MPQKFYPFQPTSQAGVIFPIVDTTAGVFSFGPGAGAPVSLITKAQGKQTSFFGVGPYLYMGNQEFEQKWDTGSPQGVTNWGIGAAAGINFVGPNSAGNGANSGSSGINWTAPGNITSAVSFASATLLALQNTVQLQATNFGLAAIAAANQITGISVAFDAFVTSGNLVQIQAQLLKLGTPVGNPLPTNVSNTVTNTFTSGNSSYLWGTSWVANDFAQTNFGVQFTATNTTINTDTIHIRNAKITVSFAGAPAVTLVAGTLTATQGFQYVFVYGNSNDNNIGNPTPVSASIKPVAQGVQIGLVASTDPQVNQIRVFRTTDTGTGQVFFEIPTSPYANATANVTDNAIDSTLQVTQAVTAGSVAFSPPPQGLVNIEWYAGRPWGSVGNLLYFSAGPDNTPMGNGNSNWPPGNVFTLPTQIVKNVALNGGNGMLVVTVDGIHVVQGLTNPGFTVNKWLSDVGARQQNAVDTDGSTIYMFTSDRQFLAISANGIQELSQPVSDQTDLLDPTLVYVMQHRSGSQDSRVFLSDGSTGYVPYNLMFGCWEPKRTLPTGICGAIGSIETSPGNFKLLMGGTSGNQLILQRDLATFADNGVPYRWNAVFGSIPLAQPTQLANVESIVLRSRNIGSPPVLSILPNDTAGTFTTVPIGPFEPPEAVAGPVGFTGTKYYIGQSTTWTQMTHLQLQIAFPAEANQDELLSFGIFPNESTDQGASNLPAIQGR